MTYNSSNGTIKQNEPDPRFKLHLLPYDSTFYDYGWFDQHHAGGPGVYHDNLYNNPTSYAKYTDHKDEIIYYGEEGAIGTPPRLQLIRDEIMKTGKTGVGNRHRPASPVLDGYVTPRGDRAASHRSGHPGRLAHRSRSQPSTRPPSNDRPGALRPHRDRSCLERTPGFDAADIAWLLDNAHGEIIVLRPSADDPALPLPAAALRPRTRALHRSRDGRRRTVSRARETARSR